MMVSKMFQAWCESHDVNHMVGKGCDRLEWFSMFFFQEASDSSVKIDDHLGCQAYSCAAIILVGSPYHRYLTPIASNLRLFGHSSFGSCPNRKETSCPVLFVFQVGIPSKTGHTNGVCCIIYSRTREKKKTPSKWRAKHIHVYTFPPSTKSEHDQHLSLPRYLKKHRQINIRRKLESNDWDTLGVHDLPVHS